MYIPVREVLNVVGKLQQQKNLVFFMICNRFTYFIKQFLIVHSTKGHNYTSALYHT